MSRAGTTDSAVRVPIKASSPIDKRIINLYNERRDIPRRYHDVTETPPRDTADGEENDIDPTDMEGPPSARIGQRRNRGPQSQRIELIIDNVNGQSMVLSTTFMADTMEVPKKYNDCKQSGQWLRWKESMNKEISDLLAHDTWELVSMDQVPKSKN